MFCRILIKQLQSRIAFKCASVLLCAGALLLISDLACLSCRDCLRLPACAYRALAAEGKVNPSPTLKNQSVARPAKGKVIVVLLHAQHCRTWCRGVRPVLEEIKKEEGSAFEIHELDISEDTLSEAKKQAKSLGVASFIPAGMDSVPCVGVFTPDRRLVGELSGPRKKATYKKYIEKAMKSQ